MALARRYQKEIEIPHEPGNFVTIKRVIRADLRRASDVRQRKAIEKVKDLGGPSFMKELRSVQDDPKDEKPAERDVKTVDKFDIDVLLEHGIVAWRGPNYDGDTVNAATVAELDPVTAEWLAEQIDAYSTGTEITEGNV